MTPLAHRAGAFLAILLAVPALARTAPQTDPDPAEEFADAIDVELLDLQVVVTDDDGRRIPDLPPEAFLIRVDGKPARIELFHEVRDEATRTEDAAAGADAAPGRTPVNYLVFVDDLMTLERNRDYVLKRLHDDLALLGPGDRMAVVRLALNRKLQILTEWTGDRRVLEAAIDEAMAQPSWGIKYIALRRMDGYIANWEGNDTRRSVLAAAGAMRLLERPEGRRAMLLVAGSWDPVEVNRSDWFSPWCVTGWCQGASVYNVLTDTANLLGYTLYAIDVEGTDPDFNWGREKRLHAVLGELARVTGGRRLLNGDRGRMLAAAIEDTRSYYSIGVSPPEGLTDRRLLVEIEMLRDGLEARSRQAFVPLTAERDRQLDVLNALWLEEGAADSPLTLRLGSPIRLGGGRISVPGHLAIPADLLTWRAIGHLEVADVTLEVASVDWRGDSSEVVERHLRLRRDASIDGEVVVPWPFEVRRRRHTFVAGLRDHFGGTSYTAIAEIAPRDPPRLPPKPVPTTAELP